MNSELTPSDDDSLLRKLRRRVFCRVQVAGADALVAVLANQSEEPPAFRAMSELAGYQRLYPTESGFVLKWPYQGQAYDPNVFRLEPGGWDHEHCSACEASIKTNETCWITKRGSFYVLCKLCGRRLKKPRRE
jgi:hypothetical protein